MTWTEGILVGLQYGANVTLVLWVWSLATRVGWLERRQRGRR